MELFIIATIAAGIGLTITLVPNFFDNHLQHFMRDLFG